MKRCSYFPRSFFYFSSFLPFLFPSLLLFLPFSSLSLLIFFPSLLFWFSSLPFSLRFYSLLLLLLNLLFCFCFFPLPSNLRRKASGRLAALQVAHSRKAQSKINSEEESEIAKKGNNKKRTPTKKESWFFFFVVPLLDFWEFPIHPIDVSFSSHKFPKKEEKSYFQNRKPFLFSLLWQLWKTVCWEGVISEEDERRTKEKVKCATRSLSEEFQMRKPYRRFSSSKDESTNRTNVRKKLHIHLLYI